MSESYQYQSFGLNILSKLELPDLTEKSFLREDISIIFGENPENIDPITARGALYQASKDNFLFKLDGIATFHVQGGTQITIETAENAVLKDVQLFLLGPVFGALMHQKGMLPLHGSCVAKNNQSTIICGRSGAGKSTLAALLTRKGYILLSDDISVINTTGKKSSVIPGIATLKLWQDVAEKLNMDYSQYSKVRDQLNRYKIPVHISKGEEENQIGNIIILEKRNRHGFELIEISGAEKFEILKNSTYKGQFIWGLETTLIHFQKLSELIPNVRVYLLRRPDSPLLLNELIRFLESNHVI